jgi:hypothetical protein
VTVIVMLAVKLSVRTKVPPGGTSEEPPPPLPGCECRHSAVFSASVPVQAPPPPPP